MTATDLPVTQLADRASEAARILKTLANEQRLLLLCWLSEGETSVGELVDLSNQSQSSVSQHLGRLRSSKLVATRRDGTTIYYRLANENVHDLIAVLCDRFGTPENMP